MKYDELLDAYQFKEGGIMIPHEAYIFRPTGKVYFYSEDIAGEVDFPEDLFTNDDYIPVPGKRELDLGNQLVFSFIAQEAPDHYETVRGFFSRRGAYGRFKAFLRRHDLLEKWFAYEGEKTKEALLAWSRRVGIDVEE